MTYCIEAETSRIGLRHISCYRPTRVTRGACSKLSSLPQRGPNKLNRVKVEVYLNCLNWKGTTFVPNQAFLQHTRPGFLAGWAEVKILVYLGVKTMWLHRALSTFAC